jgi:hypothetical protein
VSSLAKNEVILSESFKILSGTQKPFRGHHVANKDTFHDIYCSLVETAASAGQCALVYNEVLEMPQLILARSDELMNRLQIPVAYRPYSTSNKLFAS